MRIEVSGRRLDVTDAINTYAQSKCEKLLRYFDGVQEIEAILDTEKHDKHDEFSAELIVHVVKHDPFVAKAHSPDVYASIDLAVDKMSRQLTDYKEKLRKH